MAVTKSYKFIRLGAMSVTKPYEFMGFGAIDVTNPHLLEWFLGPPGPPKPQKLAISGRLKNHVFENPENHVFLGPPEPAGRMHWLYCQNPATTGPGSLAR
jgi:hypothetical protein